jgi:hypothetical protein
LAYLAKNKVDNSEMERVLHRYTVERKSHA